MAGRFFRNKDAEADKVEPLYSDQNNSPKVVPEASKTVRAKKPYP